MKISRAGFTKPMQLPNGRMERVVTSDSGAYDIEMDARGFVRVRVTKGPGSDKVLFVGPSLIEAALADAAELDRSAKR